MNEGGEEYLPGDLLEEGEYYELEKFPEVDELIELLQRSNELLKAPEEGGFAWRLFFGGNWSQLLSVGVRGNVGSLMWDSEKLTYVPESGLNENYVNYQTLAQEEFTQPPGSEVPISVVWQAVREYHKTRQRPTCVNWVVVPQFSVGHQIDDPWA